MSLGLSGFNSDWQTGLNDLDCPSGNEWLISSYFSVCTDDQSVFFLKGYLAVFETHCGNDDIVLGIQCIIYRQREQ